MLFQTEVNKPQLSVAVANILRLLEKYSDSHDAARELLSRNRQLFERAVRQEISSAYPHGFLPEEVWESGALGELDDLVDAISRFGLLLRGARSVEAIQETVEGIERGSEQDMLLLNAIQQQKKLD